ncbi:MAG TPA: bifunctional alpha,alpha-trehalose-phosphate synthase (UDP-forming)/trehalose-phosphatase [Alphaproteobacteria bacterium]|nr:bifunctional alpha,alpha-trehalose-phosphate synthase (UDP-forming)/trehalose-phosphatase [Alphaproteobacteria bacterium]
MRLVVVSNRLPFTISFKDGAPEFKTSTGGLSTGLASYLRQANTGAAERLDYFWLGWPGSTVPPEHEAAVRKHGEEQYKCAPVFLPEESMERFYHGFCNKTIWPLFHYFPSLAQFDEGYWQEYRNVNRIFGEAIANTLQPNDVIWIHDYHLMLLPRLVRERFPEIPIGFFLHIPFPSFEIFRLMPRVWREELIEGLLGSSLIGFHTHDYTRDFLTAVLRTVGYEHQLGNLTLRDRVVKVDTFPMGVDFERFARAAQLPETQNRVEELRQKCAGQKVIFSVDRLDYTKGLVNRLRGYDLFLKNNPHWHGKVVFIMSVAPSRIGVESYQAMQLELEQTIGRITGAYGTVNWSPLIFQFRNISFEEIVALYRLCDVAMITPIRDGMNLVAKEFVASRPDGKGALILSEIAGAAKELGEAVIINPVHTEDFARALEQALTMPDDEQMRRNEIMQERLRRYDVNRWADDFVQATLSMQKTDVARRARLLSGKALAELIHQYRSAGQRALLLDYDGTLVPFASDPKYAQPDADLMELLSALANNPGNRLVIISGRPRRDLEQWFGELPVALIAEHGVWIRRRHKEWRMFKTLSAEWKERVRPILQLFVDRLPGAMLEEKEYSLAWHFRRADPDQASQRAKELLDDLSGYTRNIDIQVLEGNKVIEVRNSGVNKGTAAMEWLNGRELDFVLSIGDDWTDEDMFRALPESAYSVRVGMAATAARYYLGSHAAVRRTLREMIAD